jgi:hypothetical protein
MVLLSGLYVHYRLLIDLLKLLTKLSVGLAGLPTSGKGNIRREQTEEDVLKALDLAGQYLRNEFDRPGIRSLILKILQGPKFPRERRQQQINFLADSLAAWGMVSPRRSRDICEQERKKGKMGHHIIRREFYVECSCGYAGPARNNACRNCGAEIPAHFGSAYFESE